MRMAAAWTLAGLSLLASCGDAAKIDLTDTPTLDSGASSEREAPCDQATDGTECGAGKHCINEVCVTNVCGDGFLMGEEACDDGNQRTHDGCDVDCKREAPATCGNRIVEPGAGEECDDGGKATAGCNSDCTRAQCGDGKLSEGEECDDSNLANGDSCSSECKTVPSACGNHLLDPGEACDDGNDDDDDGCTKQCQFPSDAGTDGGTVSDAGNGDGDGDGDGDGVPEVGDQAHQNPACAACRGTGAPGAAAGECSDIGGFGSFDAPALCFYNTDPTFIQKCVDLRNCIYVSGLGYGSTGPFESFCGTAPLTSCSTTPNGSPGGGNGPCIQKWYAACNTTDFATLTGSIGDLSLPCGIANALTDCDATSCTMCVPAH